MDKITKNQISETLHEIMSVHHTSSINELKKILYTAAKIAQEKNVRVQISDPKKIDIHIDAYGNIINHTKKIAFTRPEINIVLKEIRIINDSYN